MRERVRQYRGQDTAQAAPSYYFAEYRFCEVGGLCRCHRGGWHGVYARLSDWMPGHTHCSEATLSVNAGPAPKLLMLCGSAGADRGRASRSVHRSRGVARRSLRYRRSHAPTFPAPAAVLARPPVSTAAVARESCAVRSPPYSLIHVEYSFMSSCPDPRRVAIIPRDTSGIHGCLSWHPAPTSRRSCASV